MTEYVVLVVLSEPVGWQSSREVAYGPFLDRSEAATLIQMAVDGRAERVAVFPLNVAGSQPMEYATSYPASAHA
jgi:hypothetical protein